MTAFSLWAAPESSGCREKGGDLLTLSNCNFVRTDGGTKGATA